MKKLLSTMLLMATFAACSSDAQIKFSVKGTALPNATQLYYGNMGEQKAEPKTVNVENGKFTINGTAENGALYAIVDEKNRAQSFFVVDGEDITIDMNTDIATGSPLNEKMTKVMQLLTKGDNGQDPTNALLAIIKENKDNVVGTFVLSQLQYNLSYEQLNELVSQDAPFLHHPLVANVKQVLESMKLRAPGTMFTDLEENDMQGNPHKLSEYVGKGNYVLIDFWASWCGPCMMEMPNVKANYEKYKAKGFNVVGLSFDRSADAWKKAVKDNGLSWIHLSDLKFWDTVAAKTYGIRSIPSSILCGPDGKIVAIDLRGEQLGNKLKEIYGF